MSKFQEMVAAELVYARQKHTWPQPPSIHHAHSVLLEEVEEFWDEVRAQKPDRNRVLRELIQVGAMAQRAAEELGLTMRDCQ